MITHRALFGSHWSTVKVEYVRDRRKTAVSQKSWSENPEQEQVSPLPDWGLTPALTLGHICVLKATENHIVGQKVRRKPLSTRLGDVGQGGARGFAQAIKRTPTKGGLAGRVGKRTGNDSVV